MFHDMTWRFLGGGAGRASARVCAPAAMMIPTTATASILLNRSTTSPLLLFAPLGVGGLDVLERDAEVVQQRAYDHASQRQRVLDLPRAVLSGEQVQQRVRRLVDQRVLDLADQVVRQSPDVAPRVAQLHARNVLAGLPRSGDPGHLSGDLRVQDSYPVVPTQVLVTHLLLLTSTGWTATPRTCRSARRSRRPRADRARRGRCSHP